MKHYCAKGLGRVVILELERGEMIVESVESVLTQAGIKNAYIASAVGSVKHVEFHRPLTMDAATVDEYVSIDQPFELGSITGTVIDGVAHLHFSMGSKDSIQIGHLEKGTEVLYLAELTIIEIEGIQLKRMMTSEKVKKLFPVE